MIELFLAIKIKSMSEMDTWGGIESRRTVMLSRSSVLVSIFVLSSLMKSAVLASEGPPTSLDGLMTDLDLTSRLAPASNRRFHLFLLFASVVVSAGPVTLERDVSVL